MLWRDGKSLCERDGAALPVPLSDEENKFIADLNYHEDTWLGINDLETEGTFVDNDKNPITYSNWYRGEPNNSNGEDIAHIWGHPDKYPQWNDDGEDISGSGFIKNIVCVYKIPRELQSLEMRSKTKLSNHKSSYQSSIYEPVAVYGGKAIYINRDIDSTGYYSLFYFEYGKWYFAERHYKILPISKIAPGLVWRGETLQSIVPNTPGELQGTVIEGYMDVGDGCRRPNVLVTRFGCW